MRKEVFQLRENDENIQGILSFLLKIFNEILPIASDEICAVYNDPSAESPMLIIDENPIAIRLHLKNTAKRDQCIYQLAHELTHYALRQGKEDKNRLLSWFEETLCEAFSLYVMSIATMRWRECSFYKVDKNYYVKINSYYRGELSKTGDKISMCTTLGELSMINKNAENNRQDRYDIRNKTFELFTRLPKDIKEILNYCKYLNEDMLTINFDRWEKEGKYPHFVKELAQIQPKIKE